jgi:hypothetical protein
MQEPLRIRGRGKIPKPAALFDFRFRPRMRAVLQAAAKRLILQHFHQRSNIFLATL